jgi:hypothetical protein
VEIHASIFAVSDVTRILEALAVGNLASADELLPLVCHDLRNLAIEPPGQTLQPTALVQEAWFRLGANGQPRRGRIAPITLPRRAGAMRRILVERTRRAHSSSLTMKP